MKKEITKSQKRETGKFLKRLCEIKNEIYGRNDTPAEYLQKCLAHQKTGGARQ